jgi:hypothetical protein
MKKATKATKPAQAEEGFLSLAGKALSVLGEEIVEGKDKVMEVASEKFTAIKKTINKITHKKTATARKAKKKTATVKKKVATAKKPAAPARKPVKKAARKTVAAGKKKR